MSELDDIVDEIEIDGIPVRFVPEPDGGFHVLARGTNIGSLEPVVDGPGYTAHGADGEPLMQPSQWGGAITARYGSKELAVRALLSISRA